MVSMVLAAIACIFSALCYSEFATMIPVSGGAYTYTFATLGEFAAWMVGWVLMLEYAIGFIAVACAWSNHFVQFMQGFSNYLPAWMVNPEVLVPSFIWYRNKSTSYYYCAFIYCYFSKRNKRLDKNGWNYGFC